MKEKKKKQGNKLLPTLGKNKGPRVAFISSLLTGLKIQQSTIKANRWISEYESPFSFALWYLDYL